MDFRSDNTATLCPELLDAIATCNQGAASAYGADDITSKLDALFSDFFGHAVTVFPVATGTAANSLALATLCPPWGTILCHAEAHIERDECGAPEFYSGAKLSLIEGYAAKITPEALTARLSSFEPMVHMVQPKALSLTQATERGAVYSCAEIAALTTVARAHRLAVHMDGARFANALEYLECSAADMTWRAGVDVLSFGVTKNGGFAAEAVVFFNSGLVADFEYRRKRGGHLLCKSRYVSAQLAAYVETGVWQRNARRANQLAARIGASASTHLVHPVESNAVFLKLSAERRAALRTAGVDFYDWGGHGTDEIRLVVSFDQSEEDIDRLCQLLNPA